MSERKSWDVQAKPRNVPPPPAAPVREPPRQQRVQSPVAKPQTRPQAPRRAAKPEAPRPQIQEVRSSPRRAAVPAGTLRERRTRRRRAYRYAFLVLLIVLLGAASYAIWLPSFRIQHVSAHGPGSDVAMQIAQSRLGGSYLHFIPRNSTFFYPQAKVRAAILDAIPEIAAVSIKRDSFSSLSVQTIPREESFLWCGTGIDTPNANDACFDADVQGYLFKQDESGLPLSTASSTASSTPATNAPDRTQIRVYGALDAELMDGQSPVRRHVAQADKMANALKFVDAIRTLGAPVLSFAIRGDEADLWLNGQTRITYVLGHEQEAAYTAASALPTLNLTDGSIQYVDLRFPGKAYTKKVGE